MKKLKKIVIIMLCLSVLAVPVMDVTPAQAATKNVTASMKKDKNLKNLVKDIGDYTTCMLANGASKKKINLKLSGNNMASIGIYILYQRWWGKGWGSDWMDANGAVSKKQLQTATYYLFGKKANLSKVPSKYYYDKLPFIYYNKSTNKYQYAGGDWGNYSPKASISKVVRVKKNIYDVTITNKMSVSGETKKMGTTTIRVQKNKQSAYKYVVKKLQYKGTGMGYF